MAALGAAFTEAVFQFVVYLFTAVLGVFAGLKMKSFKKNTGGKTREKIRCK